MNEIILSIDTGEEELKSTVCKKLDDLKNVAWKKVVQVDVFVDGYCVRITNDGIELIKPKRIEKVIWGDKIKEEILKGGKHES